MIEKLLLDTDGAAEVLSMSRASVERLSSAGELASVRVRGMRRFRRCDLETFVLALGEDNGAADPGRSAAHDGDHRRNGHRRRQRTR